MSKSYWLMKTEPSELSIDDLKRLKTVFWDGVRNYQARNFMMKEMMVGDTVLIYHSSCAVPAVVGEGRVVTAAAPDPTQFDPKSRYYDQKSTPAKPRWYGVTVKYVKTYRAPITLAELRAQKGLESMIILRPGNRLSITPVTEGEYEEMGTLKPI